MDETTRDACAIIAGSGAFPFHVACEAKRQGLKVVAIGLQGWVDPMLAQHADVYEEVAIGQLGRLIDRLKTHKVNRAVMAGKVTKEVLFDSGAQLDAEALGILSQVTEFSVDSLLGAICERLSRDGIKMLDSSTFLRNNLCPAGVLTQRDPTPLERRDIEIGSRVARQLACLDIGQSVAVKNKVVLAVEALEGTDATIARAGQLSGGGFVVVKMASPNQDMRFDLPVLGPQTISVLIGSGARCLAVEAQKTLLLDKECLFAQANNAHLSIIGIDASTL